MLGTETLIARALRYVVDQFNLTTDALTTISGPLKSQIQDLSISIAEDMQFNQLKYFRPFEHQLKFFKTGNSERRGILAANRIGKTVSTCYETAYHLTGLYPDWWEGYRFTKPITCMVAGEGWAQVALVLQQELLVVLQELIYQVFREHLQIQHLVHKLPRTLLMLQRELPVQQINS
jgi:hypothetical protein